MKRLYILIMCLCTLPAFAQNNKPGEALLQTNGSYSFQKATFAACNYHSKVEVFSHVANDTASLNELRNLPFPVMPIFLSVHIQQGMLTSCTLWNNHKTYSIHNNRLSGSREINSENPDFFSSYQLSPLNSISINGPVATLTFTEPYGNSLYNFPLEGKLVITMLRD